MRRAWVATAMAITVAGCTGASHRTSPVYRHPTTTIRADRTDELCRQAHPTNLVSSEATTIQTIRNAPVGSIAPTQREAQRQAFPAARDAAFAAWCWTGARGNYTVYGVSADGRSFRVMVLRDWDPAEAHGPPAIP